MSYSIASCNRKKIYFPPFFDLMTLFLNAFSFNSFSLFSNAPSAAIRDRFCITCGGGSTSNKPKKDGQQKGSRGALLFAATQRLTDPGESRSSSLSHLLLFRSASTCACPLIFSSPPLPDGLLSTSILLSSRNRAERVGGDEPLRLSGEGLSRLFDFSGGLSLRLLGLMGLRRRGGGVREREALRPRLLGLGLLLRP